MNIDEMKTALKGGIVKVTFIKANGEERQMNATLDPQYLPEQKEESKKSTTRKVSTTSIPVWDMEKSAWRSFRVDSVTSFVV